MGVAGLWDVLKPAGTVRSLTHLAVKDGFEANPDGKRGFRLGIDASIWFFHAEYGREGENPVLRTLFFRCATLMHTTFLPLFVFDGPKRPDVKRGKKINRTSHKLIPGMKQIVEAFGFEWRMAPGEAEAELAYLNHIGVIDGILSDDVDNFLFGAQTVIRNSSNTLSGNRANPILNSVGKDDKNHSRIFRIADIKNHQDIQLTRGGMILIGLMSGGDYEQAGLARCGVTTAHALARCGFGDALYEAAVKLDRESLEDFLVSWRDDLRHELRTNSKGKIGRKQVALANSITDRFPDIDILLSYVKPITSKSMGRERNNLKITWEREPDLGKLAGVCELFFEWGYREAIIKRFRTVLWHSIVLRILRRAVLDKEAGHSKNDVPETPRKGKNSTPCGTPSRMITKHFSNLALSSPDKGSEEEDDSDQERLIVKVHSSRVHPSTDCLPEYRLEIAPKQLVRLTESGIKGLRVPEPDDEWASDDPEDDEGEEKKRGKREPIDPETHLRVWMPACMVKAVEPQLVDNYEHLQEQKRLKKVKKGTRNAASEGKAPRRKKVPSVENEDVFSAPPMREPPSRKPRKPKSSRTLPLFDDNDESSESDQLPPFIAPISLPKVSETRSKAAPPAIEEESYEYDALFVAGREKTRSTRLAEISAAGPGAHTSEGISSPPVKSRAGIRDLTKKKISTTQIGIKSFYSVTHSTATVKSKTRNASAQPMNIPAARATHLESASDGVTSVVDRDIERNKATTLVLSSPSKRKIQEKNTSSHSDSEHGNQRNKSPRKGSGHRSPRVRPVSPSPCKSRQRRPMATIEISSESDSDDSLPATIVPLKALPPLLRAKARVTPSSAIPSDIIDLT